MIEYLIDHAIGTRDIAQRYRLGFVGEPLPGDERFSGSLAIPYLSLHGVKSIKFRSFGADDAKYNQRQGQKPRLYNASAYFNADDCVGVCEGEIDAIAATENLDVPSLGVPGASMWQKYSDVWTPVFKDFSVVCVFADGDKAGKAFAGAVAETIGWRANIIPSPEGEDVASMIASGRADTLKAKCQLAKDRASWVSK